MSADVVIVGGAMIGSAIAWYLSDNADFDGTVTVVERDPTYERASTSLSQSCVRQQFSNPLNVRIGQYAGEVIRNFRDLLGGVEDIPDIFFDDFGYLYLTDSDAGADVLRAKRELQNQLGTPTRLYTPEQLVERWPFYRVDDLVLGSHNPLDEGYFDSGTMFDWWRKTAKRRGVTFVHDEVVGIGRSGERVTGVELSSGERIAAGTIVNAAGTRAASVTALAGLELPVEARKRFTFMFRCADRLDGVPPLTIDPSGVHFRRDGDAFMTGVTPEDDGPVAVDDFAMDRDIFEDKVWPVLAHRVPAFERIKVTYEWVGHYAYNTLDHNVIVGPHTEVGNFLFANGFSGHGLQQAPAIGRAVSEWIAYGEYRSLDLTPLGYERIVTASPFPELDII